MNMKRKEKVHQCKEEGVVVEGAGEEEFTMGVWIMVMVGMVDVAMVEEGVAVQEGVVFGDGDEAMVPSLLATMTTVNMMHHPLHVAVDVEGEEDVGVEGTGQLLPDQVGVGYPVYVKLEDVASVQFLVRFTSILVLFEARSVAAMFLQF